MPYSTVLSGDAGTGNVLVQLVGSISGAPLWDHEYECTLLSIKLGAAIARSWTSSSQAIVIVLAEPHRRCDMFLQALDPDAVPPGPELLQWLIAPAELDAFLEGVFDQRPLLVSRPDSPQYYAPWFSRAVIDKLLRCEPDLVSPSCL